MAPWSGVNLSALSSRISSTCRRRPASPVRRSPLLPRHRGVTPRSSARIATPPAVSAASCARSTGRRSSVTAPLSARASNERLSTRRARCTFWLSACSIEPCCASAASAPRPNSMAVRWMASGVRSSCAASATKSRWRRKRKLDRLQRPSRQHPTDGSSRDDAEEADPRQDLDQGAQGVLVLLLGDGRLHDSRAHGAVGAADSARGECRSGRGRWCSPVALTRGRQMTAQQPAGCGRVGQRGGSVGVLPAHHA